METPTRTTIIITDRNEAKFLFAEKLVGTTLPRDARILDFEFDATEELFDARRAFSLNGPVPILAYIAASRFVDKTIHRHRTKGSDYDK